jgi:putative nucleotidyltransferase with HDIG domain
MLNALLARLPVAERPPVASIRQMVLADLERIESYPTLSETTIRAMAMVNNPNISSKEVAGLIYRDSVVAAAVLRMANSCMYRGHKAVTDVQQAVLRIGLKECGKLLTAVGIRGLHTNHAPEVQKCCDALLKHSLFVAHLCSAMCRTLRRSYDGTEFTAGLLHDIGRVIACVKCPDAFAAADPIDFEEDGQILPREREYLGIDHCAIGYHFATRNNLPEGIVRVLLNHHRPEEEQLQQELVALVGVADRLANFAQREHKVTGYDLSNCPFFPFLVQYWPKEQKSLLRKSIPVIVVQSIRETRKMLKAFK